MAKRAAAMAIAAIMSDKGFRTFIGVSCEGFCGPIVMAIGVIVKSGRNGVVS
jgi:hypothetical protein